MPRKKRRRLEAAQEMLEDDGPTDDTDQMSVSGKKGKPGKSLVEEGYRRAKSMKAIKKAHDAGKIVRKAGKTLKKPPHRSQNRTEEMQELFQTNMRERKQLRRLKGSLHGAKKKFSFKSKPRLNLSSEFGKLVGLCSLAVAYLNGVI